MYSERLPYSLTAVLKKDIELLFFDLQKDTNGAYPPRGNTDRVGGIGQWLSLDEEKLRLAAVEGGEIVGYIEVEFLTEIQENQKEYWLNKFPDYDISKIAVLKRLAVSPRFQEQGIGSELVSLALKATEEYITGLVVLEYLSKAISLYEKMGAVRVAETKAAEKGKCVYSYLFK